MLPDESIEGQILVECPDQVVTIAPCPKYLIVPFVAVGLSKAHHIHPVTRPVFAELTRGKQAIDKRFIGCRGGIGNELIYGFRIRWKSN